MSRQLLDYRAYLITFKYINKCNYSCRSYKTLCTLATIRYTLIITLTESVVSCSAAKWTSKWVEEGDPSTDKDLTGDQRPSVKRFLKKKKQEKRKQMRKIKRMMERLGNV